MDVSIGPAVRSAPDWEARHGLDGCTGRSRFGRPNLDLVVNRVQPMTEGFGEPEEDSAVRILTASPLRPWYLRLPFVALCAVAILGLGIGAGFVLSGGGDSETAAVGRDGKSSTSSQQRSAASTTTTTVPVETVPPPEPTVMAAETVPDPVEVPVPAPTVPPTLPAPPPPPPPTAPQMVAVAGSFNLSIFLDRQLVDGSENCDNWMDDYQAHILDNSGAMLAVAPMAGYSTVGRVDEELSVTLRCAATFGASVPPSAVFTVSVVSTHEPAVALDTKTVNGGGVSNLTLPPMSAFYSCIVSGRCGY